MNKEWSELNRLVQGQIKKRDTYDEGINTLFDLRSQFKVSKNFVFPRIAKKTQF